MNPAALRHSATALRRLLEHYQHQQRAAALLLEELDGLLKRATNEEITTPMEARDIPGHRYFTENRWARTVTMNSAMPFTSNSSTDDARKLFRSYKLK
ncbi:hypothetical protein ACI2KG_00060 [Pseudomonas sp. NPDC089407]|uniref:hypothetical protein n=1 Tax=Pseudomonas sp. NPDC089407 TaxID=3364464 RepID=UPI00384B7124